MPEPFDFAQGKLKSKAYTLSLVNNSQRLFPELVYPEFIEGKGNLWLNVVNPSTPSRYAGLRSGDKTSLFTKLHFMGWKWYVYILKCLDGPYYTGLTCKPDTRWVQHLSGLGSKFTSRHKAEKVVYLEEFDNLEEARRREKQIKGWTRKKKEKLIKGEWGKW